MSRSSLNVWLFVPSVNRTEFAEGGVARRDQGEAAVRRAISSKTAALDDPVILEVADNVRVGDVTVIRAGAKARATVSNVHRNGMLGRPGELNIRLELVKAGDNTTVHLRGTKGREGDGRVGTTVALTVLFGPIGLIKQGKNVEIAAGTPLMAYVADDATIKP